MAITRTPIVDDDHTGTTGTSLDNAWKQELYDQIDGTTKVSKLYSGNGNSGTATGTVLLAQPTIPALVAGDTLKLFIDIYQNQPATSLIVGIAGQAAILDLAPIGGSSLFHGAIGMWEVSLRCLNINAGYWVVRALGGISTAIGVGGTHVLTPSAQWTQPWLLQLYVTGEPAGGVTYWSMSVYRFSL